MLEGHSALPEELRRGCSPYGPDDIRVSKVSAATGGTAWLHDPSGRVLHEEGADYARDYVWAEGVLLGYEEERDTDGDGTRERFRRYILTDHLGSAIAVLDEEGNLLSTTDYSAFGESGDASPVLAPIYTGKQWDADAGLYYFNARWYDPELGRFTTEDPIKDGGNWYAYVGNRPLVATDPTGLGPPTQKVLDERAAKASEPKPYSPRAVAQTGEDSKPVMVTPEEFNSAMAMAGKAIVDTAGQLGDTVIPGFAQGRKAIDNIVAGNFEEAGKNVATGAAEVGIAYMGGRLIQAALVAAFPLANPPISAGPASPGTTAAATETAKPEAASKGGIQTNRVAGQVGEDFLARTYGGSQQAGLPTSLGRRVIDNLTSTGIAQESKVGLTSLTSRVQTQIAKDLELLSSGAVNGVEWHFFGSRTGLGPTVPLRQALQDAGFGIILH